MLKVLVFQVVTLTDPDVSKDRSTSTFKAVESEF